MEKLITVKDVSERYGCSRQTARKYMRQCNPHMENPLTVPAYAFEKWEQSRVVLTAAKRRTKTDREQILKCVNEGRVFVPRRRE